jgi:hypothetical protein
LPELLQPALFAPLQARLQQLRLLPELRRLLLSTLMSRSLRLENGRALHFFGSNFS